MTQLSIEVGTPISCFVKVLKTEAHVSFFAQNGEEDGFCGHGLISVIRHLKENNLGHISTLISASGVKLIAKVLENGMSSLEIPVSKFDISSWNLSEFAIFFNLPKQYVIEIFRTSPLGDIAIEISSPEALKNIKLDAEKVEEFSKIHNIRIMVFFCKGSSFDVANIEIRVFCSKLYELEDIVCGSANISVSNIMFNKYGILKYNVVQPFNYLKTGKVGGYQEVEYLPKKQILILNGFTEVKKERFTFEALNIEFDSNLNPVSKTADYFFLREILTDIEVMKGCTFCVGNIAEEEDELHFIMNFLLSKESKFGTKKIFYHEMKKYIGVASLLTAGEFLEYGILLKPEFTGKGFGNEILFQLLKKSDEFGKGVICSIWEKNYPSIKIAEKNEMLFESSIDKIYKGKTIKINIYKRLNGKTLNDNINFKNLLATQKVS